MPFSISLQDFSVNFKPSINKVGNIYTTFHVFIDFGTEEKESVELSKEDSRKFITIIPVGSRGGDETDDKDRKPHVNRAGPRRSEKFANLDQVFGKRGLKSTGQLGEEKFG